MSKLTNILLNTVLVIGIILLWAWGMETMGWKLF